MSIRPSSDWTWLAYAASTSVTEPTRTREPYPYHARRYAEWRGRYRKPRLPVESTHSLTAIVGRWEGIHGRTVLRGEKEVRDRGWSLGIPSVGIDLCNEGPDLLQSVLN